MDQEVRSGGWIRRLDQEDGSGGWAWEAGPGRLARPAGDASLGSRGPAVIRGPSITVSKRYQRSVLSSFNSNPNKRYGYMLSVSGARFDVSLRQVGRGGGGGGDTG